jgi:hypothetical protein
MEAVETRGWAWGIHWVRSHAERSPNDEDTWAAVEVGNGIADRFADNPTGLVQIGSGRNPVTPIRWWTALPHSPPEELEEMLSRNVNSMSRVSDTAYLKGRQRPIHAIGDWRAYIKWDWRIFKGWKEHQIPPRKKPSRRRGQEAQTDVTDDFLFRITGQRPVGGLVLSRSKLWWRLLLDEYKRRRGKRYEGSESRYWIRMVAASWLDSAAVEPPRKREACGVCT